MKVPQAQYLVFTGLNGSLLNISPDSIQEVLPALELLRSRNVPLIVASLRTAAEMLPILQDLDFPDPFIVEGGGAVYVPEDAIKVEFKYQKKVQHYRVIELGVTRSSLLSKLAKLRSEHGFRVQGFSELSTMRASDRSQVSLDEIRSAQTREYSEPIFFEGLPEDWDRLQAEAQSQNLRITHFNHHQLLTGDHDEGSAVMLLTQLYREEYQSKAIKTIGLGDNQLSAALLCAVDVPVLVRQPDGRFDDSVGRYGMKFTRNPGPIGWNQAVIALITEDPEA